MPVVLAQHFPLRREADVACGDSIAPGGAGAENRSATQALGGDCAGSVPTHAAARRENRRRRAGARVASEGHAESSDSLAEGARAAHYRSVSAGSRSGFRVRAGATTAGSLDNAVRPGSARSEEHTSELQSPCNLVCRLLLE